MKNALFPGTFDPPTLGHLDIIERAAAVCPNIYVGVATNSSKQPLFSVDERMELLRELVTHLPGVEILRINGLVADCAKVAEMDCIIRGLRAFSDCDHEFRMALANRRMSGVETVFFVSSEHLTHISSTLIREIGASGQHLEAFVPKVILSRVYAKLIHT